MGYRRVWSVGFKMQYREYLKKERGREVERKGKGGLHTVEPVNSLEFTERWGYMVLW